MYFIRKYNHTVLAYPIHNHMHKFNALSAKHFNQVCMFEQMSLHRPESTPAVCLWRDSRHCKGSVDDLDVPTTPLWCAPMKLRFAHLVSPVTQPPMGENTRDHLGPVLERENKSSVGRCRTPRPTSIFEA